MRANEKELTVAVRHGNIHHLKKLLEEEFNLDAILTGGRTLLHIACLTCNMDIAIFLINRGAKVNIIGGEGRTPLHIAAMEGCRHLIGALIESGAYVNLSDDGGFTPLHYAAQRENDKGIILALLQHGANPNPPEANSELSPLHIALWNHNAGASHLVDYGAKLDIFAYSGLGNCGHIRNLFRANPNIIQSKDKHGDTVLHWAVQCRQSKTIELLLRLGASATYADMNGITPLHLAVCQSLFSSAKLILDFGAFVDARDIQGQTPLHWASDIPQQQIAELLLARGANIEERTLLGLTPLHLATMGANKAILITLLKAGADINSRDNSGRTALSIAIDFEHRDIQELLFNNGGTV